VATTPTDPPTSGEPGNGNGEPLDAETTADLMSGWTWKALILPAVEKHLGTSGKTPEEVVEGIAEELKPLTDQIDRVLENRANEATIDERVLALERKILMMRNAHEILIGLGIERIEQLRQVVRDELGRRPRTTGRSSASRKTDETAQIIARRHRMLGQ
jgi:hypothetical protein